MHSGTTTINNITMNTKTNTTTTQKLKMTSGILLAATGLFAMTASLGADEGEYCEGRDFYPLKGQHQFTLTAGSMIDDNYIDDHEIGTFEYSYWFSECASFTIAMGGINSEDYDDYWHHHGYDEGDDGIGMVLVGMQLRPEFFNITDRVFFTLEGLVGPYVGVDEYYWEDEFDHHRYGWDEDTETKWGAYLGLNLNVAVTNRFVIGASAGYHFVDEFEYPINGETDFNSPDFRLRFSFFL